MNAIFTDASFQNMMNVANRYGVSANAVTELTQALMRSNGTMAQFYIPELGGGGQWMQGGMTMVGDMFNNQLKNTVNGLCIDLSNLINQGAIQYVPLPKQENQNGFHSSANWWGDLGVPNSTGSQNNTNYAVFSTIGRLAIQENGKVTVFDTLDHHIGGVGQQQGGNYSVTFTSQYGTVNLSTLPIISGGENRPAAAAPIYKEEQQQQPMNLEPSTTAATSDIQNDFEEDIFVKIEKLAGLKDKNILSVDEFEKKKAELLSRL
ncbi:SHOCT domain-containing protein [Flavobacterium algicola]|uniref:SHOCT domain-containing protein n=1 Tax=Flavobacterium algicola TaxID=556529 RepID=UPI001EFCEC61|nr:SHOCT domain-containing protein [Flavobacterium algicola]MCG9790978.1 SHOCT domain-containing protein [Flavobacterium algicola]